VLLYALLFLLGGLFVMRSATRAGATALVDPLEMPRFRRVVRSFRFWPGGAEFGVGWLFFMLTLIFIASGAENVSDRMAECRTDMSSFGYLDFGMAIITPAVFVLSYIRWLRLRRRRILVAQLLILVAFLTVGGAFEAACTL
jgi:hypothetical protein